MISPNRSYHLVNSRACIGHPIGLAVHLCSEGEEEIVWKRALVREATRKQSSLSGLMTQTVSSSHCFDAAASYNATDELSTGLDNRIESFRIKMKMKENIFCLRTVLLFKKLTVYLVTPCLNSVCDS